MGPTGKTDCESEEVGKRNYRRKIGDGARTSTSLPSGVSRIRKENAV